MMAIPLTAAIIVIGLLLLQFNHYAFIERQKSFVPPENLEKRLLILMDEVSVLQKHLTASNERIDSLMLKSGFKL